LLRRGGRALADSRTLAVPGKSPGDDYPLETVQIDHSPVDLQIVDDTYRLSIGRAWISVATDLYSRMITGYYLSLEAPSALSVGLCIAQSELPKEEWLKYLKIDGTWPVWGVPRTIHLDNGTEFRSETVMRSCEQYCIHIDYRPAGRPHFGGMVESMIKTLQQELHTLPGSTFSSPAKRGKYDSERHAALTLSELERWIVKYIVGTYHKGSSRESVGGKVGQ